MFIYLYILVGYIKTSNEIKDYINRYNKWEVLTIGIACFAFIGGAVSLVQYYYPNNEVLKRYVFFYKDSLHSFPSIISAFCLFFFFKKMDFYNKKINNIAKTTYGIYVMHSCDLWKYRLWELLQPVKYGTGSYQHVYVICMVTLLFIIFGTIDFLREKLIIKKVMSSNLIGMSIYYIDKQKDRLLDLI